MYLRLGFFGFLLTILFSASAWAAKLTPLEKRYLKLADGFPENKPGLTFQERQDLLDALITHPVVALDKVSNYDKTPNQDIGFCFGRAMASHLLARQLGVEKAAIRKLFIIGDLRSGPDPEWRFHVTTLVKGVEDRKWYALDPVLTPPIGEGTPLKMSAWIAKVQSIWDRKTDPEKLAKLYLVDAEVILPDITDFPAPENETGDHLIELIFNPADDSGFDRWLVKNNTIYKVSTPAAAKYLLGLAADREQNRFDLTGITINGKRYEYNGYFPDLFASIEDPAKFRDTRPNVAAMPRAVRTPNDLHGLRVPKQRKP